MNLRHIDAFLEQHSAGWKPFSGDFKLDKDSLKHAGRVALGYFTGTGIAGAAGGLAGAQAAEGKNIAIATKKAAADAEDAAYKAAHASEVSALGATAAEALRNKRRRGLYATILTGSGPSMGSPGSSSGKSTLGA